MKIYATNITLRTVCRSCGHIFECATQFNDEPKPVEDLELFAHESVDAAGFADSMCAHCLTKKLDERTLEEN